MKILVGTIWEHVSSDGSRGKVWLNSRHGNSEVWFYSFCLSDGSGREQDWAPTQRKATELCKVNFGGKKGVIFRRIHAPYSFLEE